MKQLFGTDGIRGEANEYPMTAEMALQVGRAVVAYFSGPGTNAQIFIGKDTRLSGDMLESAIVAGICAAGGNAHGCRGEDYRRRLHCQETQNYPALVFEGLVRCGPSVAGLRSSGRSEFDRKISAGQDRGKSALSGPEASGAVRSI